MTTSLPATLLLLLGFFSPKRRKTHATELSIYLVYDLAVYYGTDSQGATRVSTRISGPEYTLRLPETKAQTVRASASLRGLPAPDLQTAAAVCAIAQAL